jgi:hypothetical protein
MSQDTSDQNPFEVTFTLIPKKKRKQDQNAKVEKKNFKPGNVPRLSRLMALAVRFEGLIERGEVQDYADLARLGFVTRARITQIMNLLHLAPDIQEDLLFLPRTTKGRDPIRETDMRPIAATAHWSRQRKMWKALKAEKM